MKKLFFAFLILTGLTVHAAEEKNLIFVNGIAEKSVEPNMLVVRFESWAKAASAQKAQEQQAVQYAQFKKQLDKYKIKKDDIQTESFNVSPEYVYDQKTNVNKITGYRVSHNIVVINRNVDEGGQFLDGIVTSRGEYAGLSVSSVGWDSDKKAQVELSALADAVKNARARANELSSAAGTTIKGVHKIQHSTYTPPTPQPYMEKAMMSMRADSASPPTELSSGQIKVRVEVQMEFEI